ncbi:unnamed protein product [Dicrocoelium dendriticum]|nr:unnamed protein product [Dicrocoelium dendriticum]
MATEDKKTRRTPHAFGGQPTIPLPAPLQMTESSLPENWRIWKAKWLDFVTLTQLDSQPMAYQLAMFRHAIGDEARRTLQTLDLSDGTQEMELDEVIRRFGEFCEGYTNETYQRYLFFSRNRLPGESIDAYITELKILARDCNFCTCLRDSLIRDRIIIGIKNEELSRRLLRQRNLSLEHCIDICFSESRTAQQFQQLKMESTTDLFAVSRGREIVSKSSSANQPKCQFCGRSHPRRKEDCPAWGRTCMKCAKKNHFARCCQATKVDSVGQDDQEEPQELAINNMTGRERPVCVFATLLIQGRPVRFQLDSGASVNILPHKYCPDAEYRQIQTQLRMWNGSKLQPKGCVTMKAINPKDGSEHLLDFLLVSGDFMPILGLDSIQSLGFVSFNHDRFVHSCEVGTEIVDNYPSVFDGTVGKFQGVAHLSLNESARPVALPARKIPIALREKFLDELQRLISLGVIAKVDEPTDWVSQVAIITKKSGDLRVCIDPKPLNAALRREYFTLPTLDDVLPELSKARLFTKVDLASAFWHVQLDEESSYLTTFGTPFGRFRWLRLPFGLKVSSEIFQKRLMQALDDLPGAICVADDVVVFGATLEEHDRNLSRFLERCKDKNIRLKREKIELRKTELVFHGHVLSAEGLKPDPEKVRAIKEMPPPTDVKAVSRLNGMVNYLSRFLPRLAEVMVPIRKLTHKGESWQWNTEQEEAFQNIKQLIACAPVLAYYDPSLPLEIQCDSSQFGIGAVLMQNGKPIDFRSRTLTESERRYAQIEKEMLALVYAVERFNDYTFGRRTTVFTDHKPLVSIANKPLHVVPRRLQRMLIRLQKYDLDIVYQPGSRMYIADTLSRAYLSDVTATQEDQDIVHVTQLLAVTEERFQQLLRHTEADELCNRLKETILKGWPDSKNKLPKELTPFFNFRDELVTQDGLIFKGNRILVPKAMQRPMLELIHGSHSGVNACVARARELMFWPGMTSQIRDHVSNCLACRAHDVRQPKEPMMLREVPERPWQKVALDIFAHDGKNYLIAVDYFSDYFEIDALTSTSTQAVINKLRSQFARHGIPEEVVSDNGPQFNSAEFRSFSEKWDFLHRLTSPYHSQSNGKAESAVKEAKKLLTKAKETKEDPYIMLLERRNMPSAEIGCSPAQRLFGRRTRTLLPIANTLLQPEIPSQSLMYERLRERMLRQKKYYDRGTKQLPRLLPGDEVWVAPTPGANGSWRRGRVEGLKGERSYDVRVGDSLFRRNRVQLRRQRGEQARHRAKQPTQPDISVDTAAHDHKTTRSGRRYSAYVIGLQKKRKKEGCDGKTLHLDARCIAIGRA